MDGKAKEIFFKVKKEVFTGQLGNYITSFKGEGLDFREIRDYNFNDNIKKINWKASNKGQGLKVNEYNEERELNISIIYLASGSMNFGSFDLKKYIASEIMTFLGMSAIKFNNKLQMFLFSDEKEQHFPPSKKEASIFKALDTSLKFDFLGKTISNDTLVSFISTHIKRKSLIFLIGDFLNPIDLSFLPYKHEFYAINIRDKFEENPSIHGVFDLTNTNDLSVMNDVLFNRKNISDYKKKLSDIDNSNLNYFHNNNIKFVKIYTNDNIFLKLIPILQG